MMDVEKIKIEDRMARMDTIEEIVQTVKEENTEDRMKAITTTIIMAITIDTRTNLTNNTSSTMLNKKVISNQFRKISIPTSLLSLIKLVLF